MDDKEMGLHCLPAEILQRILANDAIHWKDCCSLRAVSKRFAEFCSSANNELWKRKLRQTWPKLYRRLYAALREEDCSSIVWNDELKARYLHGLDTLKQLHVLSSKHYYDGEMSISDFKQFTNIENFYKHQRGQYFQIDAIEDILSDGHPNDNLTIKFYSEKVIRFLKHQSLKRQFIEYLSQFGDAQITYQSHQSMFPCSETLSADLNDGKVNNTESESSDGLNRWNKPGHLLEGAILFASWFQPNNYINENGIRRQIELIALLTVDEVRALYSSNGLITQRKGNCLTDVESVKLIDSLYSSRECEQILVSLNQVLFVQLKFIGNTQRYYDADNSFIDKVLDRRTGIPISLCVLYQAIAAKLGVKTFLINSPRHLMLKWMQHPELSDIQQQYTYIDVFDGGRFLDHRTVLNLFDSNGFKPNDDIWYLAASPLTILRRMCKNLVEVGRQQENSSDSLLCLRNALELSLIISPEDLESRMLLSRVYIHLNINLEEVEMMLSEINSKDPSATGIVMFLRQSVESQMSGKKKAKNKTITKTREKDQVKFAVGMIMRHKRYNYACVIFGWDPKCAASRDWINQMGVNNLPNKDKQPFYNVLVDDGSTRYAAQENLEIEKNPRPINHSEIGKYFTSFEGRYYVPNEEKKHEYPEEDTFIDAVKICYDLFNN